MTLEWPIDNGYQIVESIRLREPNAADTLLEKYSQSLQFLLRRYVADSVAVVLLDRILIATIAAVRSEEIKSDSEIAPFMRAILYDAALNSVRARRKTPIELSSVSRETSADLAERLEIFTPDQLTALTRYYVNGEKIIEICTSMDISEERFAFYRKMMRNAARLSAELTSTIGKPATAETSKLAETRFFSQFA